MEDIIQALKNLGGQASLNQIYSEVEQIRIIPLPVTWHASIRGCIERNSSDSKGFQGSDIFKKVDKGVWALRDQEIGTSLPKVRVKPKQPSLKEKTHPETFEEVSNILKTIKQYRDYQEPGSSSWSEYIEEFFHLIGFSTKNIDSRTFKIDNMGSNQASKAIVGLLSPGENFDEIAPGLKWETHFLYSANFHNVDWGILTDGLQLKIFDLSNSREKTPLLWTDLDGIIKNEKLDSFFPIYKIFSIIKTPGKKMDAIRKDNRNDRVVKNETNKLPKPQNRSNRTISIAEFDQSVLAQLSDEVFIKKGRSNLFESNNSAIHILNSKVNSNEWWYRLEENGRKNLACSTKDTWLCLTNIPSKCFYFIPFNMVEEQVKQSGWNKKHLEISIYPNRSFWHQLKWNIEKFWYELR
ncbi:hypothetical protein ACFLTX_01485 [Chloroflexota bacterium]